MRCKRYKITSMCNGRIELGNAASKYVEENYEQKELFKYLKMHRDALLSGEI